MDEGREDCEWGKGEEIVKDVEAVKGKSERGCCESGVRWLAVRGEEREGGDAVRAERVRGQVAAGEMQR